MKNKRCDFITEYNNLILKRLCTHDKTITKLKTLEKDGTLNKPKYNLKSWTHFFQAIKAGNKLHDLRCFKDREFNVGDILKLEEFDNIKGEYTGDCVLVEITYITSNRTSCAYSSSALENDYCILSIKLLG